MHCIFFMFSRFSCTIHIDVLDYPAFFPHLSCKQLQMSCISAYNCPCIVLLVDFKYIVVTVDELLQCIVQDVFSGLFFLKNGSMHSLILRFQSMCGWLWVDCVESCNYYLENSHIWPIFWSRIPIFTPYFVIPFSHISHILLKNGSMTPAYKKVEKAFVT